MKRILLASSILVWGLACKPAPPPPPDATPTPAPAPTTTPSGVCDPCTSNPVCAGWSWTSDGQAVVNSATGEIRYCRAAASAKRSAGSAKKR